MIVFSDLHIRLKDSEVQNLILKNVQYIKSTFGKTKNQDLLVINGDIIESVQKNISFSQLFQISMMQQSFRRVLINQGNHDIFKYLDNGGKSDSNGKQRKYNIISFQLQLNFLLKNFQSEQEYSVRYNDFDLHFVGYRKLQTQNMQDDIYDFLQNKIVYNQSQKHIFFFHQEFLELEKYYGFYDQRKKYLSLEEVYQILKNRLSKDKFLVVLGHYHLFQEIPQYNQVVVSSFPSSFQESIDITKIKDFDKEYPFGFLVIDEYSEKINYQFVPWKYQKVFQTMEFKDFIENIESVLQKIGNEKKLHCRVKIDRNEIKLLEEYQKKFKHVEIEPIFKLIEFGSINKELMTEETSSQQIEDDQTSIDLEEQKNYLVSAKEYIKRLLKEFKDKSPPQISEEEYQYLIDFLSRVDQAQVVVEKQEKIKKS